MSVAALKQLVEEVSNLSIKAARRDIANKYSIGYRISRDIMVNETIAQIAQNSNISKGSVDPRFTEIAEKYWRKAKAYILGGFKYPGLEIFDQGNSILMVYSGERSNFDALDNSILKEKNAKSLRNVIFEPFMNEVIQLVEELNLPKLQEGKGGVINFGSNFELGHVGGTTNAQVVLGDRIRNRINESRKATEGGLPKQLKKLSDLKADFNMVFRGTRFQPRGEDKDSVLLSIQSKLTQLPQSDAKKLIIITMESRRSNMRKEEEQEVNKEFVKILNSAIKNKDALDWADQESSDSVMRTIAKTITKIATQLKGIMVSDASLLHNVNKTRSKAKKEIKLPKPKVKVRNIGVDLALPRNRQTDTPQATRSYLSLMTLLNDRLPPMVRSKMGSPGLVNRTGRLSESASVVGIVDTPQGYPSIQYTYQRDPYDVFDPALGKAPWNTAARSPRKLIEASIREIATNIGMGRFYTRRV